MGRKTDLPLLRRNALREVLELENEFELFSELLSGEADYLLRRIALLSIIELNAIWARYAEGRLVIALNHEPQHFIKNNDLKGIKAIHKGLAKLLVKENSRYFDFRSTAELFKKGNKLLGQKNPFLVLKGSLKTQYLDMLLAIKNRICHGSDSSIIGYKKAIGKVFAIRNAPEPGDFLLAPDHRTSSPLQGARRVLVLAKIVKECIARV